MATTTKRTVMEVCAKCDTPFERLIGRVKGECPRCKAQAVFDSVDQLRDRSGPIYEKMVRKNVTYWTAEARRLGIAE